jgi:hypothetical protein
MEWVRASLSRGGAPRWLVIRGDEILLNAKGVSGWRDRVSPLIQELDAVN